MILVIIVVMIPIVTYTHFDTHVSTFYPHYIVRKTVMMTLKSTNSITQLPALGYSQVFVFEPKFQRKDDGSGISVIHMEI